MNIFKKDNSVEMQEQITELQQTNTNLHNEILEYRKTISSFVGIKTSYEADKEKLKKEYESKIKTLEKIIETTEKSVNHKVNESLTRIGVTVFPSENTILGENKSSDELMQEFNSLSGIEQTQFYKKHKAQLSQALGIS